VNEIGAPRLGGAFMASALLHGVLIALFVLARTSAPPPAPPTMMIEMFAAAPGPRAVGATQPDPVPIPKKQPPKPEVAKTKPKPAPKVAPAVEAPKTLPKVETKAGGGPTGGKGADVANIQTLGIEFDYPYYTTNIVRQLILRFGQMNGQLKAEVRFVINKDGSVTGIHLQTSSGSYAFDNRALAAVEAAGNARDFGPLPPGFHDDILPVSFWFQPSSFNK
jgi:protein TonB